MDKETIQKRLTIFYAVLVGGFNVFVIAAVLWATAVKPTGEALGPVAELMGLFWKAFVRVVFGS